MEHKNSALLDKRAFALAKAAGILYPTPEMWAKARE